MADEAKKTPQEEIAELQKQIVDLTNRVTLAEAESAKLTKDNETLRQTNQELFIRATRVSAGLDPDPHTDDPKPTLEEATRAYFKEHKRK